MTELTTTEKMRVCETCGFTFPFGRYDTPKTWAKRRFCSRKCVRMVPANKRLDIDEDRLRREYEADQSAIARLAEEWGCALTLLYRRLEEMGVPRRSITDAKRGVQAREKNPNWRDGRTVTPEGYVRIRVDGKYVMEHRLVMEKKIGRKLKPEEIVHHINENKGDNRPENLHLFASNSEHMAHHMTTEEARARNSRAVRRRQRLITNAGKTQSVSQWARELGLSRSTIATRLSAGWPISEVLSPPNRYRKKHCCSGGAH